MGQHSERVDAESLRERGGRRRGCLDVFFTMSIILLYAGLAAVTVCGVMVVGRLRDQSKPEPYRSATPPPQTYKTDNFVYLRANSSHLDSNFTMRLAFIHTGEGTSVGRNFVFKPKVHSLTPTQAGNYFMYTDLSVSCTHHCRAGLLRVQVGEKLTCEVKLAANVTSVKEKCWTVTWLPQEPLLTKVIVPKEGLPNWKLDVRNSGIGMFLVD